MRLRRLLLWHRTGSTVHASPWLGFLASLLCVPGGLSVAAEDPAADTSTKEEQIEQADIPLRGDEDEQLALEVLARSTRFDPSDQLARRLERLETGVSSLKNSYAAADLIGLVPKGLESLEKHWKFYERHLSLWHEELESRTSVYATDAAELAKRREIWKATVAEADRSSLAPMLRQRATLVIAEIERAEQALALPLETALNFDRRGNKVRHDIGHSLSAVRRGQEIYRLSLLKISMPPLWDPEAAKPGIMSTSARFGIKIEAAFIRDYIRFESSRLLGFLLIWVLLLPPLLVASRHRRNTSEGITLTPDAPVLRRPFSAWLLLGALLGPLVFPEAPTGLQQMALLIGLVPVLRLLPAEVFALLRWLPYVIAALYFLHRTRVAWIDYPLFYRLHLLVTALIAVAMLLSLLLSRKPRPDVAIAPLVRDVVGWAGWFAIAVLGVACVANVFGNVSLAETLTKGALESGYLAMAIFGGLAAVFTLSTFLLTRRVSMQSQLASRYLPTITGALRKVIVFGAFILWIVVTAREFQLYDPTIEWFTWLLTYRVAVGNLAITLGGVLLFGASAWIALLIAKAVRVVLQNDVLSRMTLPAGVATSVSSLTYYMLVFIGILAALAASGFEVSQLTLIIGALGVGIGLGLQNVVANFVSGLILMFERPIRPGDVIDIAGVTGRVHAIGMRATTLQTFEGAEVVVPNGSMLSNNITNWTLLNTNRRVDLDVGVSYSADPATVQELLAEVAKSIDGISVSPAPVVLFLRFNQSSLDFGIRSWTSDFDNWRAIQSRLAVKVHTALKEAGIEIPYPQHDLHLRSVSPQARADLLAIKPPEP